MPAISKTFVFTLSNDSNKNAIKTTSVTYPPAHKTPQTYFSYKEKGEGYYSGKGLHTVTYIPWVKQPRTGPATANNFIGSITMQGTLATDPTESDWFDIESTTSTFTDAGEPNVFHNFSGNYVWIRAKVTISAGVLQAIHYNH